MDVVASKAEDNDQDDSLKNPHKDLAHPRESTIGAKRGAKPEPSGTTD